MKANFSVLKSPDEIPRGFGVRQPSGAFGDVKSGRGLPQSKTLARPSESKY
jgi:hypothetical protein